MDIAEILYGPVEMTADVIRMIQAKKVGKTAVLPERIGVGRVIKSYLLVSGEQDNAP